MRLIAHRGFAAVAPENTIAAVRAAADRADAVEFDVRRCGSGELVVFHDDTIDRVTGGTGRVADCSLEELQSYTVLDSDETIPTLAELLAALPAGVNVNLEIKDEGIAADVLETLANAAVPNQVVITSFLASELRRVHELEPSQPTGLLVSRDRRRPVTTAVELGCSVIGAHSRRCLLTRLVPRAKAVDLEVHAWSVPGPIVARVLEWRGVDYVSSDRPLSV
ncbi:glycerophosphodiester phosphodiesterase family protein [Halobacteria archaeon AArc-m2/3/4]|uniref:Glycerophosphodiester phosphodiesterase family protein n=1 Tax=Natronoglomus mannanivorans TaxID=2979990 RepID=A0ABT2Q9G6_9EURY|nr:glycerophosphodiester phosphodiesterase family protein [Halobacteria archaeon AArc-m2/3/4]